MECTGQVKNGVVVLDNGSTFAEGTRVRVEPIASSADEGALSDRPPTLAELLRPIIGITEGLPDDLAENHDHYIHGRPKK